MQSKTSFQKTSFLKTPTPPLITDHQLTHHQQFSIFDPLFISPQHETQTSIGNEDIDILKYDQQETSFNNYSTNSSTSSLTRENLLNPACVNNDQTKLHDANSWSNYQLRGIAWDSMKKNNSWSSRSRTDEKSIVNDADENINWPFDMAVSRAAEERGVVWPVWESNNNNLAVSFDKKQNNNNNNHNASSVVLDEKEHESLVDWEPWSECVYEEAQNKRFDGSSESLDISTSNLLYINDSWETEQSANYANEGYAGFDHIQNSTNLDTSTTHITTSPDIRSANLTNGGMVAVGISGENSQDYYYQQLHAQQQRQMEYYGDQYYQENQQTEIQDQHGQQHQQSEQQQHENKKVVNAQILNNAYHNQVPYLNRPGGPVIIKTKLSQQRRAVKLESLAPGMIDKRKYSCDVCFKRFTRPSTLKTHMNSHTGERPYCCDNFGCGWKFSVMSNLKRHAKICSVTRNHNSFDYPTQHTP